MKDFAIRKDMDWKGLTGEHDAVELIIKYKT